MNLLAASLAGVLFALGLTLSGMTLPTRVLGFLDVAGAWDPTLAFVMAGALAVYAPLSRLIVRAKKPLFASTFEPPPTLAVDAKLLFGAGLFGLGWGLAGVCPGPAFVTLGSLTLEASLFTGCMVLGAFLFRLYEGASEPVPEASPADESAQAFGNTSDA